MKKLRRVEKLLRTTGFNGMKIIDTGTPCKCHGFMFCPTPLTKTERATVAQKGTY